MSNEVHDAKNNEGRDATKKERHACARARDGERPVSLTFVDARETVRGPCAVSGRVSRARRGRGVL